MADRTGVVRVVLHPSAENHPLTRPAPSWQGHHLDHQSRDVYQGRANLLGWGLLVCLCLCSQHALAVDVTAESQNLADRVNTLASQSTQVEEAKPFGAITPPHWMLNISPVAGWLENRTTFKFKVPKKDNSYGNQQLTLRDDGWGTGLLISGFYRSITFVNITYFYPAVNHSKMWGNISMVSALWPVDFFIKPFASIGLAYIGTDTDLVDYDAIDHDVLEDGSPTVGYGHFDRLSVDTANFMPLPEIGVKIEIPIQNWYVKPYYQYLYENLRANARSQGGVLDVYRQRDGFRYCQVEIPEFDKDRVTEYHSHVVGTMFGIDYHHFLQMHGSVYYNLTHDLFSARVSGSMMLTTWLGLVVYYEHQSMVMTTNDYVMFGLSYYEFPSSFVDAINEWRHRRDQGGRS